MHARVKDSLMGFALLLMLDLFCLTQGFQPPIKRLGNLIGLIEELMKNSHPLRA